MVPKKLILALCCSVGVTLPFAVMAQMTPQAPGGMSGPSGTSEPASGGMTPSAPSQTMPPASGGGMTPSSPGGMMSPASGGMSKPHHKMPSTVKPATSATSKTSVNTATLAQLVKVKGIGTVTAKKIVAGRPYATLEDLVTKKILTQKQLTLLKSQIDL